MSRPFVVLPGDGIGPVVIGEALRVLKAAGFSGRPVRADIGWDCFERTGRGLPDATLALLREHGVGLFGAITSPRGWSGDRAGGYSSPILELRRRLRLIVSVRPCRTFRGNPRNFIRRKGDGIDEPPIDVVVVMQNTEGLYAGVEWRELSESVYAAIREHPNLAYFEPAPASDLSLACRLTNVESWRQISRTAFEYAHAHNRRSVTLCDKWGVMSQSADRLLEEAQGTAESFPGIVFETVNADTLTARAVRDPESLDVILCGALVGDILSDLFSGLTGGVGMAACANLGPDCAVFEPLHGSAPKYADRNPSVVNPIGAILAAAWLCEHMKFPNEAKRVRSAVARVVAAGEVQTFDMLAPGQGIGGAAPTTALTDAIIDAL